MLEQTKKICLFAVIVLFFRHHHCIILKWLKQVKFHIFNKFTYDVPFFIASLFRFIFLIHNWPKEHDFP